ncbi:MAG: DUF6339 family protein [Thermomicrobium sp.]|nr:DUF6339 family protein [Thermomicrobium sp.]
MRYPTLSKEAAERYLSAPSDQLVEWRGSGERFPVEEFLECADTALELLERRAASKGAPLSDRAGGYFERDIVPLVHPTLAAIFAHDPRPAYDDDFWRWAAVGPFRTIIERRHAASGRRKGEVGRANFGFGTLIDNFVYRVWLRGEIGYDPVAYPEHPYTIALLGDQDLWRSHVFRQSYGACHRFVRALIRSLYPDLKPLPDGKAILDTDGIRELAKRLRRLYANILFEMLCDGEAEALIRNEIEKIRKR